MSNEQVKASRRKFLAGATAAAAGTAALGFPMIAKAQAPIVIKMQGAWGAKDIFNEMAQEYVKRVNEMAGGRLRIDFLVTGSVVKTFQEMDAVSQGVLARTWSTGDMALWVALMLGAYLLVYYL